MKQETTEASSQPVKAAPPPMSEQNLYEPYDTPWPAWVFLRAIVRFIIFMTMRVHLRGRYNVPRKGPYIVAANHLSWTDVPVIPAFLPGKVVFMAKEETFHSKVGWLVRFLGAFPVKRGKSDRRALKAAEDQLKKGKVFFIFPEGTRSKDHTLHQAQAGLGYIALRSGVPVVPVAISGSEHALRKFGAHVTVSYGEPILLKPKGDKITGEDIESSTAEIMQRIADMLPERYRGVYGEDAPNRKKVEPGL